MTISEISKMSMIERLQAMEAIWDSLLHETSIKSPDWHAEILSERRKKISSGEARFKSIEELKSKYR